MHKLKKHQEVLGSSRELLFIKLLLHEVLVPECCDADEMSKVSLVREKTCRHGLQNELPFIKSNQLLSKNLCDVNDSKFFLSSVASKKIF